MKSELERSPVTKASNRSSRIGRRCFLRKSATAALAVPAVVSLEEYALVAKEGQASPTAPVPSSKSSVQCGKIGNVNLSRLICGGNLVSAYAHSRDLIYVSKMLEAYFTDEKILETWAICEEHGINTALTNPVDPRLGMLLKKYRARGGRMQFLAQLSPKKTEIREMVQMAVDGGVVGAVLCGNEGDKWTREGDFDSIARFLQAGKDQGIITGVAGHQLRTPMSIEKRGLNPDFYMKTLHNKNYWSSQRPGQKSEIIDNYGIDNYWCMDPENTIRFFQELERPWIAYKVLAAGAIHPRSGFHYAFENGADFCVAGMFDFQIAEDVKIANKIVKANAFREREWMA